MNDRTQPGLGWTVVLRRQPARMVEGRPEGGYTDAYELVCCDCGDDPGVDYRDVSPELQQVRGPYPIAQGISAYVTHVRRHQGVQPPPGRVMRRHGHRVMLRKRPDGGIGHGDRASAAHRSGIQPPPLPR